MKRYRKDTKHTVILIVLLLLALLSACTNSPESATPPVTVPDTATETRIVSRSEEEPDPPVSSLDSDSQEAYTSNLAVHFIDVGQADSILILLPNDETMLIDGGNKEDGSAVVNYLHGEGIDKIDYLVATHPHEDHIGGLPTVIRTFDIGTIYAPKATANTKIFEEFLLAIQEKGLTITSANAGMNILSDPNLQIDIIAPVGTGYKDLNNYSAAIKLTFKDKAFLFMGDAEELSENQITADVKANVLKVGHHGSSSSSSLPFLRKVQPEIAVISCGVDNDYGHPTDKTLKNLTDIGAKIYRTDTSGTIIITSDGDTLTADKAPTPYAPNAPPAGSVASASASDSPTSSPPVPPPAAVNPLSPPSPDTQGITVYITDTGKKYHNDGCRYLAKSKIAIDLETAKRSYGPCSVCNPPQ